MGKVAELFLEDPAEGVREAAAEALARIGSPAVEALIRMMDGIGVERSNVAVEFVLRRREELAALSFAF